MTVGYQKKFSLLLLLAGLTVLLAAGVGQAATFVLQGNYLQVGISNSGGLIDDNFNAGINYDPAGTGHYTAADFLRPGTPLEFYSIGVNGSWAAAGYLDGNTFGTTSINTTVPPFQSGVTTSGAFTLGGGWLMYRQTVYFDQNASAINFSIDLLNIGATPIHNVVYARGLDPDQDVNLGGWYDTINTIAPGAVSARGPLSNYVITIKDLEGTGVPGISYWWDQNPYNLLSGPNDGHGDCTISMAWNIGTLEPGRSYEIDFQYVVSVVPVPGTVMLLASGLLGLVGLGRRWRP